MKHKAGTGTNHTIQWKVGHYYIVTDPKELSRYLVYAKNRDYRKVTAEILATECGSATEDQFVDSYASINTLSSWKIIREVTRKELPLFIGWPIKWRSFENHMKKM